jgi:hypothetical protein
MYTILPKAIVTVGEVGYSVSFCSYYRYKDTPFFYIGQINLEKTNHPFAIICEEVVFLRAA